MMTTRIALFGTICLAAVAQTQPAATPALNIAALAQAAQTAEADWLLIAQDLDSRVARFLPCDARATRAIQEVSSASATRLAALAQYMLALRDTAAADTETARQILASHRTALATLPAERSDIAQENAGIESQILNLNAPVRQRASLAPALEQLQQIQAMIATRSTIAGNQVATGEQLSTLLNDLIGTLEDREAAIRSQAAALETERTRWNAFYAARADRARLECTITGGGR